jgi:hypothetical protein
MLLECFRVCSLSHSINLIFIYVPTTRSSLCYYSNLNMGWKKLVVLLMYGVRSSYSQFLQVSEASTLLGFTFLYVQLNTLKSNSPFRTRG